MNQDYLKNYNAAQQGRFSGPSSESPLSPGLSQKEKDLVRARVRKSLELQQTKAKIDQEEAQYEASWSGKSGFDRGGVPATVLNTGAKVWSEMARLTGAAASTPANTYSVVREQGIPDDAREAYGRYQNDEATEADMAALNRREVIDSIEGRRTGKQGTNSYGRGNIDIRTGDKREPEQGYERPKDLRPYTNLQNLKAAERASDVGEAITDEFDLKSIVDPTRQLKYSRDLARGSSEGLDKLKTAWDDITGGQAADGIADGLSALTGLALNAGEATLRNPVAFTQLAIEQLPQLALASTSMGIYTVSNVGAGLELYHDGVMNYQNDNDGALPSVEQKEHMLTNAFAYAAATQMGDIALLKTFLPGGKKVAEGAVKTGVGRSAGNIGKAAVKGTGIETVQEGYQTYAEGQATNRPATAGQIYEGAAMGGAVGGGISAVGRASNEFKGNTEDQARNRDVEAREEASRKTLGEEAYQTGDVSRLLDPKKRKEYSPAIAMGALQRRAVDEGLSPEARKKSADEASKLVTDMQARAEEVKLSNGLFAPENASILKKRVADLEKQKTELTADDTQGIESIENEIVSVKDVIKRIGKMSAKERRAMEQETQEAVDAAAKVSEMYNAMDVASSAAETAQDDVGMDVRVTEANNDAGTAEGRASTDIVIRSAMKNPNAITSDDAMALAENTKNSLTDTERTYMRRYSEAQSKANLEKGPKGVQAEIFTGGKGFVGLSQYRAFVNKAIKDKDETTAGTQLGNLRAFAKQHAGKKAAVESALEDSSKSGKAINLYYTKEGGWRRTDKKISKTERNANAGLTIAGNSKNLVESIAYEAEAIQAVSNELEAAYEVSKQAPNETTAPNATPTVSPESEPTDTSTETVPADVNAITQQDNAEVTPVPQEKVKLTGKTSYTAKDQVKSDKATKFIGRGSKNSSTRQYAKDWGDRANTGEYTAEDTVFVSAEGQRKNRKPLDTAELGKATQAGATVITDDDTNRQRPYNSGEREAAAFLTEQGYTESEPGTWTPSTQATAEVTSDVDEDSAYKTAGLNVERQGTVTVFTSSTSDNISELNGYKVIAAISTMNGVNLEIKGPNGDGIIKVDSKGGLELIKVDAKLEGRYKKLSFDALSSYLHPELAKGIRKISRDISSESYSIVDLESDLGNAIVEAQKNRSTTAEVTNDTNQDVTPADTVTSVEKEAAVVPAETSTAPTTEPTPTTDGTTGTANTEQEATPAPEAKQETGKLDPKKSRNTNANGLREVMRSAREIEKDFKDTDPLDENIQFEKAAELKATKETLDTALTEISEGSNAQVAEKAKEILERNKDKELTERELAAAAVEMGKFMRQVELSTEDMFNQAETTTTSNGVDYTIDPETGEIIETNPTEKVEKPTNIKSGMGRLKALTAAVQKITGPLGHDQYWSLLRSEGLGGFFKQKFGGKRRVTTQPLTNVENFMSELRQDIKLANEFLPEDMTAQQENLIREFLDLAQGWNQDIADALPDMKSKNPAFMYEDYMYFLRDRETGEAEQNLLSAVSVAVFAHLLESGTFTPYNNKEDINAILGREAEHPISNKEFEDLGDIGVRDALLINRLGQRAAQALGMDTVEGANLNVSSKVITALGNQALGLMTNAGLIETTIVTETEFREMQGDTSLNVNPNASPEVQKEQRKARQAADSTKNYFIKLNTEDAGNKKLLETVNKTYQGTGNVFADLFSVTDTKVSPTWKPTKYNQKTINNTNRGVPKELAKLMAGESVKAHLVRQDGNSLMRSMSKNAYLAIGGRVSTETRWVHQSNEKTYNGKNDGLEREYDDWIEFTDAGMARNGTLDTPFYMDRFIAKPQRAFIKGAINPQGNKLQRGLVSMVGWKTKVDMSKPDSLEMESFWLGVGEAMGLKTDAEYNDQSVLDAQAIAQEPVVQKAVIAIMKGFNNETLTNAENEAIVAAADRGGEGYHSLDGLTALAHMEAAKKKGETTFEHSLTREVDGKTNGPMFAIAMLAAAGNSKELIDKLIAGGFFSEESGYEQVNAWAKNPKNHDLYKQVAGKMAAKASEATNGNQEKADIFNAVYSFTGQLSKADGSVTSEGRKLVKQPITALMFGSGFETIAGHMQEDFLQSIYDKIETIANDSKLNDAGKQTALEEVWVNTNKIIGKQNSGLHIVQGTTLEQAKGRMNKEIEKAVKQGFASSFGEVLNDTMDVEFGSFIETRNALNEGANVAFKLYDMAYAHEKRVLLESLVDSKDTPYVKRGKTEVEPVLDLKPGQDQAIKDKLKPLLPVMHSAASRQEGDAGLDNGIFLAKSSKRLSSDESYRTQTNFNKNLEGRASKTITVYGWELSMTDPGVAAMILGIHSMDSLIAARTYSKFQALNVHDAAFGKTTLMREIAKEFNKNTLDVLSEYSVPNEISNALERTLVAFQELTVGLDPNSELAQAYAELEGKTRRRHKKDWDLEKDSPVDAIGYLLGTVKTKAWEGDLRKLEAFEMMAFLDQYSMQEGNHKLTPADKERLAELKARLQSELDPKSKEAALTLKGQFAEAGKIQTRNFFNPGAKAAPETSNRKRDAGNKVKINQSPQPQANAVDKNLNNEQAKKEPMGVFDNERSQTNKPITEKDAKTAQSLIDRLKAMQGQTKSARDVVALISKNVPNAYRPLMRRLASHPIIKTIPVMVSNRSSRNMGTTAFRVNSETGDYVAGSEQITLNTESFEKLLTGELQFADNTATKTIAETVIHELLHGALNHVFSNSKSADAMQLKKRVEAVQGDIAAWVQNNPKEAAKLSNDTVQALREMRGNAREVLTYGLTASRVQAVMKVIPSSNKKSTAWGEFVTAIRGFLRMENTQQSVMDEILSIADAAFEVAPPGTQQNGNTVQEQDAMVAPDPADQIAGYTVDEIFKGLENAQDVLPMAEKDNLTGLLDSIVERLHGPYGAFHDAVQATQPLSPEEVFYAAKANRETPFSSATLNAGFTLNDQQAFVLEQVEATVAAGIDNDPAIYREMNKVWKEASQELKGKITDDQWAHLFDIDGLDALNRSPHLSQFAAVAMVDPEIRSLMGFNTYKDTRSLGDMKLGERLATIFQRILQAFNGRLTKSYSGQQADQKVRSLVEQLISIESKAKRNLVHREATMLERAGDYVGNAALGLGAQIGKAGRSKMIQGSKVPFIKPLGSLTAVVAENRVDEFLNDLQDLRDQTMKKREGFLAAMMTEMRGAKDAVSKQGHALLRYAKTNEHERMAVVENTRKNVLDSFRKDSKGNSLLSKKDKVALNRAYLHTGAADLLTDFTAQEIGGFVTDPAKRKQAIADYEARLANTKSALNPYYAAQAKSLAYHMVTGNVSSYNLMLNAGNIARMYGTKYASQVSETEAQAIEAVLDPLISLYAMDYTNAEDLNLAKQVTLDEADRGNESGIEFVLKLSKGLKAQSKELNFDGSDVLMQKGYTAEIFNHNKQVKVADVREGADLVAKGWKKVSILPKDKGDGTKEQRALYIINDGGMTRRLSGNFSLTAEKPRGFELHNGTSRRGTTEADQLQKRANYVVDKEVEKLLTNGLSFDPTKQNESKMAPVLDGNGNKVNYRYVMSEANKDNYLDRHNSFEDILGAIASSTFDKVSTKDQNRQAVQALKDQFDSEYKQKPDSYLRVALDSKDAGLREAFALMPDDTKQAIKEIWGEDAMFVRTDLVDVNFGYRKMSMASAFEKDAGERAAVTEFFVHAVENIPVYRDGKVQPLGKRAALRIRQAEDVWQQAVKEIKDIIVVKNVVTLLGNIASNATLLLWLGVPPGNLARDHREALDAVLSYRKESAELGRLKQQQAIGTANNRQRIRELEDSLSRNKAKKLIDAGLLPTIVEDIDMTDDPFSYKSRITEKTEKWVSKVPSPIRTAGRWAYMTHDTPAYKVLSQTTQLSDFVARYTAYKHLTTRRNKQMSESDAIQTVSDMFINYDLPTHRGLQYANDMGLVFFTKYFLRIQKTLMQMYQDQPARAIALITFNIMLGGLPTIMDAAITQRMYNPLQWGAFEMGGALGELPAVKLGLSPFN